MQRRKQEESVDGQVQEGKILCLYTYVSENSIILQQTSRDAGSVMSFALVGSPGERAFMSRFDATGAEAGKKDSAREQDSRR